MDKKLLPIIACMFLAACTHRIDGVSGTESDRTGSVAPPIVLSSSSSAASRGHSVSAQISEQASLDIDVPFTTQAPFARWDPLHEEACEEASLIMMHHFLEGTTITPDQAEKEIQALVAWEFAHRYRKDVTAEELAKIAQEYYGYKAHVDSDTSPDHLRALLIAGHPLIVPMAGRLLGNPNFSGAGPWYHMIVLRGYEKGWFGEHLFITNDPGTRKGEKYTYSEAIFENAIHDWVGVNEKIAEGSKRVVIVEKP